MLCVLLFPHSFISSTLYSLYLSSTSAPSLLIPFFLWIFCPPTLLLCVNLPSSVLIYNIHINIFPLSLTGAIKSWQQMVSPRCFAHGTEMTWLRKWSSPWPQRVWGPSALHTEISLPLRVNLTGTMKMTSSLDWPASASWALKTQWDPRLVATQHWTW